MPSGLKRYQTSGHDHFLTFTCYHGLPLFKNDQTRPRSSTLEAGAARSSAPIIQAQPDEASRLSPDQWWALFDQLRLAQQPAYAEVGGPVAFIRHERDADTPAY